MQQQQLQLRQEYQGGGVQKQVRLSHRRHAKHWRNSQSRQHVVYWVCSNWLQHTQSLATSRVLHSSLHVLYKNKKMCQDGMQNVSLQVRFPRNYSELVHWHSIGYTSEKRGAPVTQTTCCNGVSVSHNSHSASTRSLWHRLLCVYIATCQIMWFTQAHPMIEQPMDTIVWNLKHSTVNGTKLAWVANQQSSQDVRPSNSRNILATDCYSIVSCKSSGKLCYWFFVLFQLTSYCLTSVCTLLSGWESCCQCFCWLPWVQMWQRLEHQTSTVKQQKVSPYGIKTCKNQWNII